MPSKLCRNVRGVVLFVFIFTMCLIASVPTFAQTPPPSGEATGEDTETAERIRVLESQKIRQDERSSMWGGTGLVFTRTAILLPRKHFNMSGYFNFSHYQYLQGWQPAYKLDDPRGYDYELNIVANYGLTHYLELGAFMNAFLDNEKSDADALHMRQPGIGWTGLDLKYRIMDIDKEGLGITATLFTRFPSLMKDANLTSEEIGYGGEINFSLKGAVISDWLESLRFHMNWGWAYVDYFDTGLAALYQFSRDYGLVDDFAKLDSYYRGEKDYALKDLFNENWGVDDVKMEKTYFGATHYTGSVAFEYRPILGLSTGLELVGYRMVRFSDDNLMLAPFVTYTFRQIPFVKKVHRDLLTASLAGNFGMRDLNRSAPQWGAIFGLTWHSDLKFLR